jgi:hypothetical protein
MNLSAVDTNLHEVTAGGIQDRASLRNEQYWRRFLKTLGKLYEKTGGRLT